VEGCQVAPPVRRRSPPPVRYEGPRDRQPNTALGWSRGQRWSTHFPPAYVCGSPPRAASAVTTAVHALDYRTYAAVQMMALSRAALCSNVPAVVSRWCSSTAEPPIPASVVRCVAWPRPGYSAGSARSGQSDEGQAMASEAAERDGRRGVANERMDAVEQIPDEVWEQFVQVLREKAREVQASQETRAEFVQMLLDKVRADPFPSRQQLDLIEESLPPEMVADYARMLIEKAGQEPFPSQEILRRIQNMT
jgi:hypothetical protein